MKGYFKPYFPEKYKGDPTNIIYRSSWELKFMQYLDAHKSVKRWSSEEIVIPYRSPIDGKLHRYFPDFWVEKINRQGKKDVVLVEVKPYAQTQEPKVSKNLTKRYLNEVATWGINTSKWKAADEYCKDRGWSFMLMTERELGIKY